MSKIKELIEKVYDECTRLYEQGGVSAVLDHVNKQMELNNPLYAEVKWYHCTSCKTLQPVLNNTCLVCGKVIKPLGYGDEIRTMKQVRDLTSEFNDEDLVVLETCDENGDVIDLYSMYIELKDDSMVNEVRFCQIPNVKPDTKGKQPVVDRVIKEIRSDMLYGDETILNELLKQLPLEILINSLPEDKMKAMYDLIKKD
jgi:hypothetical protein